jgi:hypothetical protein
MQGTKAYGVHVEPMKLPGKEREPRHQHENFYWMQEDYLRGKQENGHGWGWTIDPASPDRLRGGGRQQHEPGSGHRSLRGPETPRW